MQNGIDGIESASCKSTGHSSFEKAKQTPGQTESDRKLVDEKVLAQTLQQGSSLLNYNCIQLSWVKKIIHLGGPPPCVGKFESEELGLLPEGPAYLFCSWTYMDIAA